VSTETLCFWNALQNLCDFVQGREVQVYDVGKGGSELCGVHGKQSSVFTKVVGWNASKFDSFAETSAKPYCAASSWALRELGRLHWQVLRLARK